MASTSCRNALGQQAGSPSSSNGEGASDPPPSPSMASTSHGGTERGTFKHEAASSMPPLPSTPSFDGGVHDRGCANAGGAGGQRAAYEAAAEGANGSAADGAQIASPSSNDPKRPSSKLSASSGSASPERMCSSSPVPPSLSTAVSSSALESRSRSPMLEGRLRPRALPSPNRAMLDDHAQCELSERHRRASTERFDCSDEGETISIP